MRSQIIQRDSKLIGDELIEKFISQDKKVLKYIDSFYSNKNVKKHSENKTGTEEKYKPIKISKKNVKKSYDTWKKF